MKSVKILIENINPYNKTHPAGYENKDKYHRDGIDMVKKLILAGKNIRPIAVEEEKNNGKHQRMDGFKRYFAYKELGYKDINCVFCKKKGCQDKMPWEVQE